MIGIPYAMQEWDYNLNTAVAICPECEMRIPLGIKKDFESFTGEEYQAHYHIAHQEKETP